jgi:hypothetical protein
MNFLNAFNNFIVQYFFLVAFTYQIIKKNAQNISNPRSPKALKPSITAFGGRLPLKNIGTSSAAVGLFLQAPACGYSMHSLVV